MTKKVFLSFAVLALFAVASMAVAQPGGARGQGGPQGQGPQGPQGRQGFQMMGGGGVMGILMNEEARTAIGVTEAQIQAIREAARPTTGDRPTPGTPGEGRPDPAEMQARMQAMQEQMRKAIEEALDDTQVAKLDTMVFQQSGGLEGFGVSADSLRVLGLTDDQKKKLEEAQAKMREAMPRPEPGGERPNFEQMRETMEKAREAFQAELKGILTAEQTAKAEELMKDVPEYLQRRGPGADGPGNRGNNFGNWQPGDGPQGTNPNREAGRTRSPREGGAGTGRQFPN